MLCLVRLTCIVAYAHSPSPNAANARPIPAKLFRSLAPSSPHLLRRTGSCASSAPNLAPNVLLSQAIAGPNASTGRLGMWRSRSAG